MNYHCTYEENIFNVWFFKNQKSRTLGLNELNEFLLPV